MSGLSIVDNQHGVYLKALELLLSNRSESEVELEKLLEKQKVAVKNPKKQAHSLDLKEKPKPMTGMISTGSNSSSSSSISGIQRTTASLNNPVPINSVHIASNSTSSTMKRRPSSESTTANPKSLPPTKRVKMMNDMQPINGGAANTNPRTTQQTPIMTTRSNSTGSIKKIP